MMAKVAVVNVGKLCAAPRQLTPLQRGYIESLRNSAMLDSRLPFISAIRSALISG